VPRPAWNWAFSGCAARILVRLSGTQLVVYGRENLPLDTPCILVANHASYLDGILLAAALPTPFSFLAKREFTQKFIPRIYLQHLGADFVERFDLQQELEDTQRLIKAVRAGRSLAFFPEGTFTRAPGLRPFHLGAFIVAAQTMTPVLPIAIHGTRSILRAGNWLPRRGTVTLAIGMPIRPAGTDWASAIKLRDQARAHILAHCREPDLAEHSLKI
jgi:1-acyl-sn-glycerol-3-phosphate acyltransferase